MDISKWRIIAAREPALMLIDMQEPNPQPGWEEVDMKGKPTGVKF